VGWLKPGQTGTVPSEVIPGSVLSPRSAGVKNATIPTPTDSHGRFSFGVYPNPAQNMVHISLPAEIIGKRAEISLITMNGQVVRQMIKNIVAEETIDLSSINSGLYIIRILSDQLPLQTVVSVVK
jgi:urease alpha subunit